MYDITDYGACGDGKTLNTSFIQKALDECGRTGGTVRIPPGTFLTGTIYLRSNTELHLEKGAVLLGSPDLADYNEEDAYEQNWFSNSEGWSARHLILAVEVHDVSLTGEGMIDGNGRAFFTTSPRSPGKICWRDGTCNARDYEHCGRPGQEIVFVESTHIRIRDLRLRDMACWSCYLYGCENVQIRGLAIENGICNLNTDGIDIDSCRNVTVSDCLIRTGDDAIAVRGSPSRLKDKSRICENITIQNCVFFVSADGFRVGVGSGAIRNVVVSNIVIEHAGRGIHLQNCYGNVSPGVNISHVLFSDIVIRDAATPILLGAGSEKSTAQMKNIVFRDIDITSPGSVIVAGAGGTRIENVSFFNVFFQVEAPEKEEESASCFSSTGVSAEAFFRGANYVPFIAENAQCILLENFRFRGAPAEKALFLRNVTDLKGAPTSME